MLAAIKRKNEDYFEFWEITESLWRFVMHNDPAVTVLNFRKGESIGNTYKKWPGIHDSYIPLAGPSWIYTDEKTGTYSIVYTEEAANGLALQFLRNKYEVFEVFKTPRHILWWLKLNNFTQFQEECIGEQLSALLFKDAV